jgi:hypothetical protein
MVIDVVGYGYKEILLMSFVDFVHVSEMLKLFVPSILSTIGAAPS